MVPRVGPTVDAIGISKLIDLMNDRIRDRTRSKQTPWFMNI